MKKLITNGNYFCKCERCGHKWISRKGVPKVCANPSCHSPIWNKPKAVGNQARKTPKPTKT